MIDDHTLFLKGISLVIRKEIPEAEVDTFSSITAFTNSARRIDDYQLIITDFEMPDEDTLAFITIMKGRGCPVPFLILTMHNHSPIIRRCKELGVEGYLLKDDHTELIPAIQQILAGGTFYSQKASSTYKLVHEASEILTPREEDILRYMALGKTETEVSETLFISLHTVRTHKRNIKKKLNLNGPGQLIRYAIEHHLK